MLKNIDHVGIAVRSTEEVKRLFAGVFGLQPVFEELVPDQQVKVVGFRVGGSNIEYLEATSENSPIARFVEKRGEGLHHIAFAVDEIVPILRRLKEAGIALIDEEPKMGAEGKKIAFVHPSGMSGVLWELSESPSAGKP